LHRYVSGEAVPVYYAPVERFARVCRATPEELVELHRRWVLADARRRQRATVAREERAEPADAGPGPQPEQPEQSASESDPGTGSASEPQPEPEPEREPGTGSGPEGESRVAPVAGRRRRVAVLAAGGVAAVALSAALIAGLLPGDADGDDVEAAVGDDGGGERRATGDASVSPDTDAESDAETGSGASPGGGSSESPSPSGGPDASDPADPGASDGAEAGDATAPTVVVEPYEWPSQCEAHYLVDQDPAQVPPPPSEATARGWVTALGGVAAGEQWVRLTVQGTGEETVVLEGLNVWVVDKDTPLPWNDYVMGTDGCGGPVETRHFGVDLDAGRPEVTPEGGERDFPYSVSENDPEVYYVAAGTQAYDVSWYLELEWSSGGRRGTVRIDDEGEPFRLSANEGRPAYDYPLGYNDRWEVNDGVPGAPTDEAQD
jgi:hypothetical protein